MDMMTDNVSPMPGDAGSSDENNAKVGASEELVRKLTRRFRDAKDHSSDWRNNARNDYDFQAGRQWTDDEVRQLEDNFKAALVFNHAAPMIKAVTGAEISNRKKVAFVPREVGDVRKNELVSAAGDWARQQCDAEDEESEAFSDVVVCGMGWTETRMDFSEDPEGAIVIERVDPLEMYWDPLAKKKNLTDARYVIRAKMYDDEEGRAIWDAMWPEGGTPDTLEADLGMSKAADHIEDEYRHASDARDTYANRKQRLVCHHQWWDLEPVWRVFGADGQVQLMTDEEMAALVAESLASGSLSPPRGVRITRRVYKEAFVTGTTVLSYQTLSCNGFTLQPITGERDRNNRTWYGLVRVMRDPQRWANKWLSQSLYMMNNGGKGGVLFESGAFRDVKAAQEDWSAPNSMVELQPGGLNKIKEIPTPPFPAQLDRLITIAMESLPRVSGINLELLGLVQKEQAGVLEAQRKQAGYAILAVYFDSLRLYRKRQGRILLHFIREYISDSRLIRIKGEDGSEQYVPLVRDDSTSTYDIIVDEAPTSANQKDIVWQMIMGLMPWLEKAGLPPEVWAELVRYSPLPASIGEKIAQALTKPNPQAEQMQQLEAAQKAADVEKTRGVAAFNQAKARKGHAEASQAEWTPNFLESGQLDRLPQEHMPEG